MTVPATFCDGRSRRQVLRAGLGGLAGLSLADVLRLQARSAETGGTRRDTAVIFIEQEGGPTQFETYDPKPLAPVEFRDPIRELG